METNAFLLFIPLLFILLFSGTIYRKYVWSKPFPDPRRTDSLLASLEAHEVKRDTVPRAITFHSFDPNQATESELIALQLKPWIAKRIVGYRSKGGTFRKPEDVLRIYGMDSAWHGKAKLWMRFASPLDPLKGKAVAPPPLDPLKGKAAARQKSQVVRDINEADTTSLIDVYGIGPTLARRIIVFRDKLGGFVSFGQLREVYGLDSTVVARLGKWFCVKNGFRPRQLNINRVTLDSLDAHPYISRKQALAILTYGKQHGGIDSVEQLLAIPHFDPAWLVKISPYLSFERNQ
jgi:DNA uptake protein ComE-like DNA-binding protein